MDLPLLYILRAALWALNCLPHELRVRLIATLLKIFFAVAPSHDRVAVKNLKLAFPEHDDAWRRQVIRNSYVSLARLIVDFARLPELDSEWVKEHVDCDFIDKYKELRAKHPGKGIVYATGHLGSFELLAHSVAAYGYPVSFVIRNATLPNIDRWWLAKREAHGNRAISRKGAVSEVLESLQIGRDVGILFDQNVRREHAVFVNWFGKPAATTKMVALVAIRTQAPVVVGSVRFIGNDRYKIEATSLDFADLYADTTLELDEKVKRLTQAISTEYERMIRLSPSEWFWMHRRWKTRPLGDLEKFY